MFIFLFDREDNTTFDQIVSLYLKNFILEIAKATQYTL